MVAIENLLKKRNATEINFKNHINGISSYNNSKNHCDCGSNCVCTHKCKCDCECDCENCF